MSKEKNKYHAQTCLGYVGGSNSLKGIAKIAKEYLSNKKIDFPEVSVSIYSQGKFLKYIENKSKK